MRKLLAIRLCLGILASQPLHFSAYAAARCTLGSEDRPAICSYPLPEIIEITIEDNGARSSQNGFDYDCKLFHLTEREVRNYFENAGMIGPEAKYYKIYESPCYAAGTMVLANGRDARWYIDRSGAGVLVVKGEKPKDLVCHGMRYLS